MSAPIQIVDEDDRPISEATKQEAWHQGLRHRVIRIMVENDAGDVLLQHRDPAKDIFPNRWDNSVAGHVDAGEDYLGAAHREALEELGLKSLRLERIGKYESDETWQGHRLKRFTIVYKAHLNYTPLGLEKGKIDDVRWFSRDSVIKMVNESPDLVSDGLRQVVQRYY